VESTKIKLGLSMFALGITRDEAALGLVFALPLLGLGSFAVQRPII
jgi:hypothetical protein